jgi:hypothetical protein
MGSCRGCGARRADYILSFPSKPLMVSASGVPFRVPLPHVPCILSANTTTAVVVSGAITNTVTIAISSNNASVYSVVPFLTMLLSRFLYFTSAQEEEEVSFCCCCCCCCSGCCSCGCSGSDGGCCSGGAGIEALVYDIVWTAIGDPDDRLWNDGGPDALAPTGNDGM